MHMGTLVSPHWLRHGQRRRPVSTGTAMSRMTREEKDEALDFDAPEHVPPWPSGLKVGLGVVIFVFSITILLLLGLWIQALRDSNNVDQTYGPLSFTSPARVVDEFGQVPRAPGLPPPAVTAPDERVPVRLTRKLDCAVFDCPQGSLPVVANVSWIELNDQGVDIGSVPIVEDLLINFNEVEDYIPGTLNTAETDLPPFRIPDEVLQRMLERGSPVSAWRIEGTTTPNRPDGLPAAWATEVFHIRYDRAGE